MLRLADALDRDEDEIDRQARAVADKHDLGAVMGVFRPNEAGGVGAGAELFALAEKPLTPKGLEDRRDDLMETARVTLAVARATPLYAPHGRLTKRDWLGASEDMKDRSLDLIDALKGDDLRAIEQAAGRLNRSCNPCHVKPGRDGN